ncbi:TetR/AcrR family transcriptional regulator [Streptomyces sp. NPDC048001]|uniref:TetR/AcrR family transcriptional regulator n=1 Tax=Streptomyces sp. NPDC048001 TaxID=3365498 RepID=UPI0037148B7B
MPRQVDREARREQILGAAVRVFARQGYAASRIEDIAREAGVAKGSVYLSFGSREELLRAAFDGLADRSGALLAEVGRHPGGPAERLAFLVRAAMELLEGERDLARVLLDVWSAGARRPAWIDMAGFYREYRAVVAGLLEERDARAAAAPAVAPSAHATVLVGAIEGCVLQWLFDPEVELGPLVEPLVTLLVPPRA